MYAKMCYIALFHNNMINTVIKLIFVFSS